LPFRTTGFHLHYGLNKLDDAGVKAMQACPSWEKWLVKCMDLSEVAMLAAHPGAQNPLRRTLYGRAGEYRVSYKKSCKKIEYRSHSSVDLAHPLLVMLACEFTRGFFRMALNAPFGFKLPPEETVRYCINECDSALARAIIREYEWLFRTALRGTIYIDYINRVLAVLKTAKGFGAYLKLDDDENFKTNWCVGRWTQHINNTDCTISSFGRNHDPLGVANIEPLVEGGVKRVCKEVALDVLANS